MAISFVGGATAATATISIPGVYQNGDLLVMYAFNNAGLTIPTIPAGWTSIASNGSNATGYRLAWKLAGSASEISGTWTNATGLVCLVYRGVSTLQSPINSSTNNQVGTSSTLTFPSLVSQMKRKGSTSWVIGFVGTVTATNAATPPTGMVNRADGISLAGHDTNGPIAVWSQVTVTANTASAWQAVVVEILAESLGPFNNYQFIKAGDGMATGERIR